jgi:tripartite-type tricarboxylate transporter receptor subunit TctC
MNRKVKKILFVIAVFGLFIYLFQTTDLANAKDPDYPTKPITLLIGFSAGGPGDLTTRAFVEPAAKYLGQSFVPEYKTGAAGSIALMAVMNAKPDGYTLGMVLPSSIFVAPFSGDAEYKDLTGLTMIANFGAGVYPLMVKSDAPWKTWKEFIEWAKKNPRAAKMGIAGAKSVVSTGIMLWQVEKREQVEFTCVPFKASNEILTAVLGGHITVFCGGADATNMQYVNEGKLRILTYLGTVKASGYENISSMPELYGFEIPNVQGIVGPKGLPDYVLEKLADAFAKAIKNPDFINVLKRFYTPVVYMDRAQMTKYVDENFRKFGEIMKAMKAEEEAKK